MSTALQKHEESNVVRAEDQFLSLVERMLSYGAQTGVLRWRVKVGRGNHVAYPGDIAGARTKAGYITISLCRRRYYAHRLAWLCAYKTWPRGQIDHKNGNRADNRLSNLRDATAAQNTWNGCARTKRPDGLKGVWFHKLSGLWAASIMKHGNKQHLGYYKTPEDAHAAYRRAAKDLHEDFARVA